MNPRALLIALTVLSAAAYADGAYQVDLGANVRAGTLMIEPTVSGPANATVRYDMQVKREGEAGSSTSSQAGTVKLDGKGEAHLASNSVSVAPSDRYEVTVKLFDGDKVVAEQSHQYP